MEGMVIMVSIHYINIYIMYSLKKHNGWVMCFLCLLFAVVVLPNCGMTATAAI